MNLAIIPMSLGDIFDRISKLIGKTALRNFIIALLIIAPGSVVLTYGMDAFLTTVVQIARESGTIEAAGPESLSNLGGAFVVLFVSLLLFGLATLAAMLGVTIVACGEMTGQSLTWNETLAMTFDMRLLYVIGQVILQYLAIASLLGIPVLAIIIAAAVKSAVLGMVGGFLFVPAIFLSIFFAVRWAFTLPVLAWEDEGIIGAFRRSSYLVRGMWWRTLGILILLTLVIQFAISIITTPVSFVVLWDFFAKYFEMLGQLGAGEPDPTMLLESFDSFGLGIGIVTCVSSILSVMISPLAITTMYFDLRARNREFMQSASSGEFGA
jgi:hypothetical protein